VLSSARQGPDSEARTPDLLRLRLQRVEDSRDWCLKLISKLIHEMSQPLTILYGEMHLALRNHPTEASLRAVVESSVQQVDRLSRLVRRLREMAQVERPMALAGGASLVDEVREAVETYRPVADLKQATIVVEEQGDGEVAIAAAHLRQTVHELVKVAVQRSPRGGSVFLSLSAPEEHVALLRVVDQGPALSSEEVALLLDPLMRSPARRTDFVDSSLEWCLAKRTAEAWWGSFNLESGPERGCTASLVLPVWRLDGPQSETNSFD